MHLKRLELLGYKTFASRTEFLFNGGITAVVGPNGSGKSNIADAVRWVLGEQSFTLLRAKKSEDMIFSGSERRSRMGMAEVTITLDNSDDWLPIEFAEIAITRRSYRSGENEYLMNGSKVRLRDIADLLGKSGLSRRTYTVIGQGLVDTALSLRPEERRALIEEAAGLTLYQARRANALSRLEETRQNVLRVHDLIAEIAPRLKRLEGQAERTREYDLVRAELDKALGVWYSFQWKHGQEELRRRRQIMQYQLEQLESQRAHVREWSDQGATLRIRQSDLRRQLGQWHRESSTLHAQSEAYQRDLAVAEERCRLLNQKQDEHLSTITTLEAGRAALAEQIELGEHELSALQEMLDRQRVAAETARAAVEAQQNEVARTLALQSRAQKDLLDLRARIADHESRLAQSGERKSELQDVCESHRATCRSLESRIDTLEQEHLALQSQLRSIQEVDQQVQKQLAGCQERIAAVQTRQRDLTEQRNEREQRLGRLRERYELLERMHEEGVGLYDGVRCLIRATRDTRADVRPLDGILGTVAELVEVPPAYETAIEVALGGQLQDIVVDSWQHAQAAIEYLKRTRGGRATCLPLDTLRAGQPVRVPRMEGVVGLASTVVRYEDRLQRVVDHLLGRTIICRDLTVAHRLLNTLQGSYQIVTPDGELVRSSGAVTGGTSKRQEQGGMLARERERRELPERLGELEREQRALKETIEHSALEDRSLREQVAMLLAKRKQLDLECRDLEQQSVRGQQQIEQARREQEWHGSLITESEQELSGLGGREAELQKRLGDLTQMAHAVEAQVIELAARIERREERELEAQWTQCRTELASTQQLQAARQAALEGYQRNLRQLDQEIKDLHHRTEEVTAQLASTEQQILVWRQQEGALGLEIQAYVNRIGPAEQEVERLEEQQAHVEEEERRARSRLQALESRHGHTQIEVARQEDHMADLRRQIKDDLGLVELEMGEELSGQPLLPLGPLVSSLPEVQVLPEGVEEQIGALKRRLRRLEPVNPNAPAEYDEVRERYDFLSTQAQDLEQASAHLREVIAELDAVMEREFRRAFSAISREFRLYFEQLFGGGSARLQLTDPEDLMNTGIEIMVRPPGKRQQGLAVLSGGERALTAAALIFAILKISPPPFCVLDEVDAALDEANVGRFRAVLKELSQMTQFVVITHNRYTIETADVLYGISMSADGSSVVLSRQMESGNGDPKQALAEEKPNA